jgi:hypothetical protein
MALQSASYGTTTDYKAFVDRFLMPLQSVSHNTTNICRPVSYDPTTFVATPMVAQVAHPMPQAICCGKTSFPRAVVGFVATPGPHKQSVVARLVAIPHSCHLPGPHQLYLCHTRATSGHTLQVALPPGGCMHRPVAKPDRTCPEVLRMERKKEKSPTWC